MSANFRYLALGWIFIATSLQAADEGYDVVLQPFFEKHCVKCHGPDKAKSGVRLDELPMHIDDDYAAEEWQEVLDVLNGAEMPPEDEPQPETEEMAAAIEVMTDELFQARKRLVDPKSITIRRLNKREYANTIRDLLGVPVDTSNLPADGTLDGFDTIGDAHFMSVPQFEAYLELARVSLDRALVNGPRPEHLSKRTEPELHANQKAERTIQRFEKSIAELRPKLDGTLTNEDRAQYERLIRKFEIGQVRAGGHLRQPAAQSGFILQLSGADHCFVKLPRQNRGRQEPEPAQASLGDPIGRYVARFRAGLTCEPTNGERLFVELLRTNNFNMQVSYRHTLGAFEVSRPMDDPHVFEVPFENRGELDDLIALQVGKLNEGQTPGPKGRGPKPQFPDSTQVPYVWIDWIEVEGPIFEEWPPAAWQTTFFKGDTVSAAEESGYAREIIAQFANRAFRGREVGDEFLHKLQGIYADYREDGTSFADSVKEALAVVLSSPSFVYLVEPSEKDEKRRLSDLELAARLSYFLWSHPPDAELQQLAETNQLHRPRVFAAQVDRLLNHPKADHFTKAFMSQWLELEWLDMIVVNTNTFPSFTEQLRHSMRDEPVEMFREMLREDLSITTFIDSDFVKIDGMLSRFYGLELVNDKPGFQKVSLPDDSPRGGLLGTGAVLTMTGTGERTSPVERGVFVYHRMLGKDIPPPPPNVPQLVVEDGTDLSVRQLLEAHTNQAQCASCHRRMDPLGFGLERFDAIGTWLAPGTEPSATENHQPNRKRKRAAPEIDASGVMPDRKRTFNGHEELKAHLMTDQDAMAEGFVKSILTYALGRRVGFSDGLFVDQLLAEWKAEDYGMRTLIHQIVESEPFQSK
ncbi:MAG: DUF1592 domain-containing protein [Verrucomicrobiota bacterium]